MQGPLLIINCKNYSDDTTSLAKSIARAAITVLENRRAEGKKNITIALAVPATDIYRVASLGLVPVLSEHLDGASKGATTGSIIAEDIKNNGAVGSLINHSEDPYTDEKIKVAVKRAKEVGITSVVCAKNAEKAKAYAAFKPDFIAMEPPELIGGDISVSKAKPSLISDTVASVRTVANIPVLVGAGVKDMSDVQKGIELGAEGILVASGVTKATDVQAAIADLANGFN